MARTDYINSNELARLESSLNQDNKNIVALAACTGLRISDIVSLPASKLSSQRPYIRSKKTGKTQRYYFPSKLYKSILSRSGALWAFPSPYGGGAHHRTRSSVYKAVRKACRDCGLSGVISPHSLRKYYAVSLFHRINDLEKVRLKLQHDNLTTTFLYAFADKIAGK